MQIIVYQAWKDRAVQSGYANPLGIADVGHFRVVGQFGPIGPRKPIQLNPCVRVSR